MAVHILVGAAFGLLAGVSTAYLWVVRRTLYWFTWPVFLALIWLYSRTGGPTHTNEAVALSLAFLAVNLTSAALLRKRGASHGQS